jgi:hypothetical protein
LFFFDLLALESNSLVDPDFVELVKMISKHFNWVIIVDIEHLELLDNNQDEQVEHDMRNNQDE